jgi:hypothetical protein
MSTMARYFARTLTGVGMVAPLTVGGVGFASVPLPDPPMPPPPSAAPSPAAPSRGQEVHWMLSRAAVALRFIDEARVLTPDRSLGCGVTSGRYGLDHMAATRWADQRELRVVNAPQG